MINSLDALINESKRNIANTYFRIIEKDGEFSIKQYFGVV